MYERFTDRARSIMRLASVEAHQLNDDAIDDEHLLLSMVLECGGVASFILRNAGITADKIRGEIDMLITHPSSQSISVDLPLSPRAKRVMYNATKAAADLGDDYIGTEHLLLGLLSAQDGLAVMILLNLEVSPRQLKNEVLSLCGVLVSKAVDQMEKEIEAEKTVPPRCDACRFAKISEIQVARGFSSFDCTRFPPLADRSDNVSLGDFPKVRGNWSCGEFRPKAN